MGIRRFAGGNFLLPQAAEFFGGLHAPAFRGQERKPPAPDGADPQLPQRQGEHGRPEGRRLPRRDGETLHDQW